MSCLHNSTKLVVFFVLLLGFIFDVAWGSADFNKRDKILLEIQNAHNGFVESFVKILDHIPNEVCRAQLNRTFFTFDKIPQIANQVYPSLVKVFIGVESYSEFQFGNFDECLDSSHGVESEDVENLYFKYCISEIRLKNVQETPKASRIQKQQNTTVHKIRMGICMPASCSANDINSISKYALYDFHINQNDCTNRRDFIVTTPMMAYAGTVGLLFLIVICCTLYHMSLMSRENYSNCKDKSVFTSVIVSFSIVENLKKMLQKSNDKLHLDAINGVKALSMLCILAGHALLFIVGGPVLNPEFSAENIKYIQNAFLLNSTLFVDTFLLLSGFLFCRILLVELERRRGKINFLIIYIFRYIRLTPAYLAVIGFYTIWFYEIGSGPLWNSKVGLERERCDYSWWLNILYVNNYFNSDKICMFQSWYLSVDTQLFVFAPILIYLLWKFPKYGVVCTLTLALLSVIFPTFVTFYKNLDPTLLPFPDEISDISTNTFFANTYIKTHMRTTPYIFGILTGFFVYVIHERSINLPRKLVRLLWILSTIIGVFSMFSITIFLTKDFTNADSSLYAGMHRLGWSLANGWLVLAVTSGNAGFLGSILSSRFFAPISRLTYCMYLMNGLVELYCVGTLRNPVYLSYVDLLGAISSHIMLTMIAAVVLCLLFESPIHGFEKILLRSFSHKETREKNRMEIQIPIVPNQALP